jgi:hypothetical protein
VPRQYSVLDSKKVFDTEEVIVGTKYMPIEDYFELRDLYFTITVFFNSAEFIPLKRFLIESNVNLADWIFAIHKRIPGSPDIDFYRKEFCRETREELFESEKAIFDFYSVQENFDELKKGNRGDNLSRKYKYLTLFNAYSACLELAITECASLIAAGTNGDCLAMMADLRCYLETRNVKFFFESIESVDSKSVGLTFDIPRWLNDDNEQKTLGDYKGPVEYRVMHKPGQKKAFEDAIHTYKDSNLSLQIIYRDGMVKDFWPHWDKA